MKLHFEWRSYIFYIKVYVSNPFGIKERERESRNGWWSEANIDYRKNFLHFSWDKLRMASRDSQHYEVSLASHHLNHVLSEKVQKGVFVVTYYMLVYNCKRQRPYYSFPTRNWPKKRNTFSREPSHTLPINGGSLRYMCPTLFVTKYYQTKTLFLLCLAH